MKCIAVIRSLWCMIAQLTGLWASERDLTRFVLAPDDVLADRRRKLRQSRSLPCSALNQRLVDVAKT